LVPGRPFADRLHGHRRRFRHPFSRPQKNRGQSNTEIGQSAQRDHCGTFARPDQRRDVVAHARERIAAAGPSIVLVVARDQVDADVADGEFGDVLGDASASLPVDAP
jgi:hypothetical protein